MFLSQIVINLNDGTDWPKLKRGLKFLLLKKKNKLEKGRHFEHHPSEDLFRYGEFWMTWRT